MSKIRAVLDQIEAEQRQSATELIPKNVSVLELAQMVIRGEVKLSSQQLRMLIEVSPFYAPKLRAVGVGHMTNNTFAERLERAITASERAKLIEGRPIRDE